jgi:nucleoside-diphosphate-sugar epimerase
MKCNIGITGHSGILGTELINNYKKSVNFIKFYGDIRNTTDIKKWVKKNRFDGIVHLAAIVPIKNVNNNKQLALDINFKGTVRLLKEFKKKKIWFFFASSSHVYKKKIGKISENSKKTPITFYGKTKFKAENFIINYCKKNKNIRYCIGRIFSFTHPEQQKSFLIPSLVKKINSLKNKKFIIIKNSNVKRDFLCTSDICSAIMILFKANAKGIFNIGSGDITTIKKLVLIIKKNLNVNKNIVFFKSNKNDQLISSINKIKKLGFSKTKNLKKIIKNYLCSFNRKI